MTHAQGGKSGGTTDVLLNEDGKYTVTLWAAHKHTPGWPFLMSVLVCNWYWAFSLNLSSGHKHGCLHAHTQKEPRRVIVSAAVWDWLPADNAKHKNQNLFSCWFVRKWGNDPLFLRNWKCKQSVIAITLCFCHSVSQCVFVQGAHVELLRFLRRYAKGIKPQANTSHFWVGWTVEFVELIFLVKAPTKQKDKTTSTVKGKLYAAMHLWNLDKS